MEYKEKKEMDSWDILLAVAIVIVALHFWIEHRLNDKIKSVACRCHHAKATAQEDFMSYDPAEYSAYVATEAPVKTVRFAPESVIINSEAKPVPMGYAARPSSSSFAHFDEEEQPPKRKVVGFSDLDTFAY